MSESLQASVEPKYQGASAASYALTFSTVAHAREFSEWASIRGNVPPFTDPRDKSICSMRVRPDKPYDVRMKQRLLSTLWEPIGRALAKLELPDNTLQRHVNGYKGVFGLIDRRTDDYWELAILVEDVPGQYIARPHFDQFAHWGMDKAFVEGLLSAVNK